MGEIELTQVGTQESVEGLEAGELSLGGGAAGEAGWTVEGVLSGAGKILGAIGIVIAAVGFIFSDIKKNKMMDDIAKNKQLFDTEYAKYVDNVQKVVGSSEAFRPKPATTTLTTTPPPTNAFIVTFDKFPEGTLSTGFGFNLGMPSSQHQMHSNYKITRVKLSLTWQDQGWGDESAALNLWRGIFRKDGRLDVIASLNLAHYQRTVDKAGYTIEKVFTPDDGSFWKPGAAGEWVNLYYNKGGSGCTITFKKMNVQVFGEYLSTPAATAAAASTATS